MLDAIDQRIMQILKQNSRTAWGAICLEIGISRQSLRKRITRLEAKQHILGYTIHSGQKIAEHKGIEAFLRIRFMQDGDIENLAQHLPSYNEVIGYWGVTGDWDVTILLRTDNMDQVRTFRNMIKSHQKIDKISTEVVIHPMRKT